jgi:RimJ/RimL family protein N-acetyltransferase
MRPHGLADFPDSLSLWSDPGVTRHIGGRPFTEEEVWARLMRYGGFWTLLGYGFWVVRERDGDRFVGEVGFFDGRRGLGSRFSDAPEVGWAIMPSAQGRGLAQEALAAALAWGDARWERTVCMIHPENAASVRLAERVGFQAFERTTLKETPTVLFERRR